MKEPKETGAKKATAEDMLRRLLTDEEWEWCGICSRQELHDRANEARQFLGGSQK